MKNNRNTAMLRRVMSEANAMTATGLPRATAMKKGWLVAKLAAILSSGAMATFTFIKADGELREMKALPAKTGEYLVKGTGNGTPKANMLVWDVEKQNFRSFCKARIQSVAC